MSLLRHTSTRIISQLNTVKNVKVNASTTRMLSSYGNITYSGGQATEGQGGYYGSGGARKLKECTGGTDDDEPTQWQRPQMLALAADVSKITSLMDEVDTLENLLHEQTTSTSSTPTGKMIEIKSKIKKLCTQPELVECLNRLEIDGEPVWGLSSDERDMIVKARNRVSGC